LELPIIARLIQRRQPLGTALGVVQSQRCQLRYRHAISVVQNVPCVTGRACTSRGGVLAERVAQRAQAVGKHVARKALSASSRTVPLLAVVVHWHALATVAVEDVSKGACQAFAFVPVPSSAANVGHLLHGSQLTFSVVEVVPLVTSETSTLSVGGSTLVGDRHALTGIVEDPVAGAGQALFVVPVPSGAAEVSHIVISRSQLAFAVRHLVSLVTSEASTLSVESGALVRNRHANTIAIENPVA
jgi:hypothetical protein